MKQTRTIYLFKKLSFIVQLSGIYCLVLADGPARCPQVIQTHFWMKRNEIMVTVAGWISELEGQGGDERTQRSIQLNLMALKVTH